MALPTYTVTGTVATVANLYASFAAQTASLPPVQTAYLQNVNGQATPLTAANYVSSGTGAAQVQRIIVASGALTTTASTTIDLSSAADIIGVTTAMAHVREIIIFNDGRTAFTTADADVLTWDLSVANAFGLGAASVGPVEGTNPKIDIAAGASVRFAKPFGTNGWVTDGSHKIIGLSTNANTNTINYRVIVAGD